MGKNKPTFEADNMRDFWENGVLGWLVKGVKSLFGKYTGTSLTDAEREANEFTAGENTRAMNFSSLEAEKNRQFQAEQAATQWQRGVADMQAAGLNPALAYGQGGASAMSGSAPSGSAGSSVGPAGGSLSDLLELAYIGKKRQLYDAQIDEARASAEEKRANAGNKREQTKWIAADMLSMLGLREEQKKEVSARIDNILSSTRGQEIQNSWSGKLLEQQFEKGQVEIAAGLVGIEKAEKEIDLLIAQKQNTETDTQLKLAQKALALASASLARAQAENVSLDSWQKQFDIDFEQEFGTKPNLPIWSSVTGLLGKASRKAGAFLDKVTAEFKEGAEALGKGIETVLERAGKRVSENIQNYRSWIEYYTQ